MTTTTGSRRSTRFMAGRVAAAAAVVALAGAWGLAAPAPAGAAPAPAAVNPAVSPTASPAPGAGGRAAAPVTPAVVTDPTATTADPTATTVDPNAAATGTAGLSAVPDPTVATVPSISTPNAQAPAAPKAPGVVTIDVGSALKSPSESVTIIVLLTLISVAPSLLIMMTSFTRTVIVLSLTRNAMGLQTVPPNQVVVGLAVFLSLFVMGPTLNKVNHDALQPYLKGTITQSQALKAGEAPIKQWMLKQTRQSELALFVNQPGQVKPKTPNDVGLATLIPAFLLSEIKTAFIMGFVIFIPFLVIDLIVSSTLMSMGMMMLPPVLVSLPFKILLFVLVDGWGLVVTSLLKSFR